MRVFLACVAAVVLILVGSLASRHVTLAAIPTPTPTPTTGQELMQIAAICHESTLTISNELSDAQVWSDLGPRQDNQQILAWALRDVSAAPGRECAGNWVLVYAASGGSLPPTRVP